MTDQKQDSNPRNTQQQIRALEEQIKEKQLREYAGAMAEQATSAPKPWVELSIEEKIERTREHVKGHASELRYAYERLSEAQRELGRLRRELVDHRHDSSDGGRVMLPASEREKFLHDGDARECANSAMDADPGKVYF